MLSVDIDPRSNIDFYAGNERSFLKLLPVWNSIAGRRGTFFVSRRVHSTDTQVTKVYNEMIGSLPIVVCSYQDLHDVFVIGDERPYIVIETEYSNNNFGLLNLVSLFLCKDELSYKYRKSTNKPVKVYADASQAAQFILEFIEGPPVQHFAEIDGKTVGIIYMAFGAKALASVEKSIRSLHRLGYSYPVAIVGPWAESANFTDGFGCYIKTDIDPFDYTKAKNFQFRAGRIKTQLCSLSPFDYNLYIDADTRFVKPVHSAFELLRNYDLLVTEENLSLEQLYNKKLAGWELNLVERDITIEELGGDSKQKFINSGVIFFRKNDSTKQLFIDWWAEWLRFQEWDEQLALMRAIYRNKVVVKRLPVEWNSPHLTDNSIIFHNYGRGDVRETITKVS